MQFTRHSISVFTPPLLFAFFLIAPVSTAEQVPLILTCFAECENGTCFAEGYEPTCSCNDGNPSCRGWLSDDVGATLQLFANDIGILLDPGSISTTQTQTAEVLTIGVAGTENLSQEDFSTGQILALVHYSKNDDSGFSQGIYILEVFENNNGLQAQLIDAAGQLAATGTVVAEFVPGTELPPQVAAYATQDFLDTRAQGSYAGGSFTLEVRQAGDSH